MAEASRIVVMGPSGSGKTVVGAVLATRLDLPFVDADDLHPDANVAKMAAGTPLADEDRWPWLDIVAQTLRGAAGGAVVACSALARRYRDRIREGAPDAVFVELKVSVEELARRMSSREHFMPSSLLASQLAALEPLADDERGVVVVNDRPPIEVADGAVSRLRAAGEA
ncbi:gluconokinase [Microbacterium sp. CPCC 204701]|uniref:gluconokinase n=1 Tax=Microbacterium sp. CPCC 204701 TaxID=2493084 RepID=UPI000FD7075C|nr:gluconokinase [Microbacterium sp. CPCC 204701]